MRCAGVLPYAWVADNTRWMRKPRTDGSLEACLRRTAARRTAPCKELLKEIGGREICDCWRKLARPVTFFAEASPANSVVGGIGELFRKMARPAGFEPATPGLEGRCSIQLSYGRVRRGVEQFYRFPGGRGHSPGVRRGGNPSHDNPRQPGDFDLRFRASREENSAREGGACFVPDAISLSTPPSA